MDINFELYKIFYYAAVCKNFTEAAEKLFMTQSAVSQAIRNLEAQIGCRLFYRKARNVTLTQEGELLFRHVKQAFIFIKTGEKKIIDMQNLEYGEIRIGVSDTICRYFLIPLLKNFYNTYPNIKIQVFNRTSSGIVEALKSGFIDFGIITLPIQEPNISVKNFIDVQDIFVACDKFSMLRDREVDLSELCSYPLLLLDRNSTTRRNLDLLLKENGLSCIPEIEMESMDLLVEFGKIGLGIAHVLRESAREAIEKGELFEIKLKKDLPPRKLGIITMKDLPPSRSAEELIRYLHGITCPSKGRHL